MNSIIPSSAPHGDTVLIIGQYLLPNPNYDDVLEVRFNGEIIPDEYILENYKDSIKLIIPKGTLSGPVTVDLNEGEGLIGTVSADFIYEYTASVSTFAGDGDNTSTTGPLLSASFSVIEDMTLNPLNNELLVREGDDIKGVSEQNNVVVLNIGNPISDGSVIECDNKGFVYFYNQTKKRIKKSDANFSFTNYAGIQNTPGHVNGPISQSTFTDIFDMHVDRNNNVIIGDNNYLRLINTNDSMVTTIAGGGSPGILDGPVATAKMENVFSVQSAADGSIYFADRDNHRIRKVKSGMVTTVAGKTLGFSNGPTTVALLNKPANIAYDGSGKIYFTDAEKHCVRMVDLEKGTVSIIAGDTSNLKLTGDIPDPNTISGSVNPFDARFDRPTKLVYSRELRRLFIWDADNHKIRQIVFE